MKEINDIENINKELKGFSKLQGLKGKKTFTTPDSFFDNLEDDIMSKIAKETTPVRKIQMNTKQVLYYIAAASIVALFIFIALRSGNQNSNQPQIADKPVEVIDQNNAITDLDTSKQTNKVNKNRNDSQVQKVETIEKSTIAIEDKKIPLNERYNKNGITPQSNSKNANSINENTPSNYDIANNNDNNYNGSGTNNIGGHSVSNGNSPINTNNYTPSLARKAVQKNLYLGEDQCSNKDVSLNALVNDIENLKYKWSTKDTTSKIIVRKSGSYWVKIYDFKDNLLGSDTINITIIPQPHPNLGGDRSICNYESVLISSGCKNSNFTYKWSINDVTTPEIYLSDIKPGVYEVELTVMSCIDTVKSSIALTVNDCNIKIPNVITPNGDGRNDRFVITGLNHYPGSQLHVLDRNGHIVYEAIDYQNDWTGNNLPAGTYFYRLQLNDGKKSEKNGTLTIIR